MPTFSILDQSIAIAGRPQGASIRDTIALAQWCDQLGYARFWVSEHHNHPTIVGSAPEILIAAIAATTTRIRVGSAGVMLPHYSPYKVAEQFRVLDAIAPGRIDLGLGRAPGSDGRTAFALNPNAAERPDHFPSDVRDLLAWVAGTPLADGHPFAQVKAYPQGDTVPEMWILGSSDFGARVAAHFGLPYSFAWFFTDGQGGEQALDIYRQTYRPSPRHPEPRAGICVWALAADDMATAERHFAPRGKWRVLRDRGVYTALESPETALAYPFTDHERARYDEIRRKALIGTAPDVARRINELGASLGVDEIAIVAWAHDEQVRRRSYELLARELIPPAGA
ncbi:MAG: LLM class flavin-dependent oxidoreductase [Alphaproteobacteria bacterium]